MWRRREGEREQGRVTPWRGRRQRGGEMQDPMCSSKPMAQRRGLGTSGGSGGARRAGSR